MIRKTPEVIAEVEERTALLVSITKQINSGGLSREEYEKKKHLMIAFDISVKEYIATSFALGEVRWTDNDRLVPNSLNDDLQLYFSTIGNGVE